MRYIYDKVGNKLSTKHIGTDEEFYQEFGNEIFISDTYLGEKAVVDGNVIRAKTEVEKVKDGERELLDGEYIDGNEIKVTPKPSDFHYWEKENNIWTHDKEKELSVLNNELEGIDKERFVREQTLKEAEAQNRKFVIGGLKKEIAELTEDYNKKYARYEELTGQEEK